MSVPQHPSPSSDGPPPSRSGRLSAWWPDYQWLVIAILSVLVLGLGLVGFRQLSQATGQSRSWTDSLYLALQLFTLESGSADGPKTLFLEIARFAAPALVASATILAGLALFRRQWQRFRLRSWTQHVVVCGLGEKGLRLTQEFLQRGEQVVVVEVDETNGNIPSCQEQGAVVLVGNAANPTLLDRARVQCAKHLIAVTGDDGINVEIAIQAQHRLQTTPACQGVAMTQPTNSQWCYVHLQETTLRELLGRNELLTGCRGACRARFFDIYENAARLVFRDYPPDIYARLQGTDDIHLLIAGFGRMGENLALQAARTGHYASQKPIRLTVVDAAAEKKIKLFRARYPQFSEICPLDWHTMRLEDPEFVELKFLGEPSNRKSPTMAFICLENEKLGFLGALHLFQTLQSPPFPILVRVRSLTGLASLARAGMGQFPPPGGGIYPFGSISETCNLDLILHETLDTLAKTHHASYVRLDESRGKTPQKNPSMVPWEELPDDLKNSNLLQAEHLWVKVRALGHLGYRVRPKKPLEVPDATFTFPDEVVELLARMEHNRWNAERWLAGWTLCGPGIDKTTRLAQKLSPYLVPYDDLSEEIKEYDRNYVRDIPAVLAMLGYMLEPPPRQNV